MVQKIIVMGFLVVGVLAMVPTETNAYTYTGSGGSQCPYKPGDTTPSNPLVCSFHPIWELVGGQQPGSIAIIESIYTVTTAALVCTNPSSGRPDIRIGVGGITIVTTNPESALQPFDARGKFRLSEGIPTAVPEFDPAFPDGCAKTYPAGCEAAQAAFEEFYGVTNADCRNPNWLPFEYYFGAYTAAGTVYRDCTDPTDTSTCAHQDDNVLFSCTPNVSFKNYSKVETVTFTCTCISSCSGGGL